MLKRKRIFMLNVLVVCLRVHRRTSFIMESKIKLFTITFFVARVDIYTKRVVD